MGTPTTRRWVPVGRFTSRSSRRRESSGRPIRTRRSGPAWALEGRRGRCKVECVRRSRSCARRSRERSGRRGFDRPVAHPSAFDRVRTTMRLRPCLIAGSLIALAVSPLPADEPKAAEPKETFWVIPHTHWEGAVFKTREEYLDMGLANILKAMRLLERAARLPVHARPGGVRPAVPGAVSRPRRPISAGSWPRGGCSSPGALDVMPDDNMPGGETFVRQMHLRQGLLSREARRRRDDRLAARHLRPPRPDAAIAGARRVTSPSGSSAACPGRTSPRSSSGKGSTARGSMPTGCRTATGSCIRTPKDPAGVRRRRSKARFNMP